MVNKNDERKVFEVHTTGLKQARKTFDDHPNPTPKRNKAEYLIPMIFGMMRTHLGKPELVTVKMLCDTGATSTSVDEKKGKHLRTKKDSTTK